MAFVDQRKYFGEQILFYLRELGMLEVVRGLKADHACVRFKNAEDVEALRAELSEHAKLISSAMVNRREICLFELQEKIKIGEWEISCLELPTQSQPCLRRWLEHMEFVVPSNATTLEEFREDFKKTFLDLDLKKPKQIRGVIAACRSGDQLPNPTISLTREKGVTVKFHPRSIQEVVGFKK